MFKKEELEKARACKLWKSDNGVVNFCVPFAWNKYFRGLVRDDKEVLGARKANGTPLPRRIKLKYPHTQKTGKVVYKEYTYMVWRRPAKKGTMYHLNQDGSVTIGFSRPNHRFFMNITEDGATVSEEPVFTSFEHDDLESIF